MFVCLIATSIRSLLPCLVAALGSITLEDRDPIHHPESDTMNPNGQHNQLLRLRARLLGDMNQLADAALQESNSIRMPSDMADVGTDAFEQELTLDLMGNEKEVLEQIEAALKRIEDGSYGTCEECGKNIAKARLAAIPYAALCVGCAAKAESGPAVRKPR